MGRVACSKGRGGCGDVVKLRQRCGRTASRAAGSAAARVMAKQGGKQMVASERAGRVPVSGLIGGGLLLSAECQLDQLKANLNGLP